MFTRAGLLVLGLAASFGAFAQSVALTGILGEKALLIIDGAAPKLLAAGQNQGAIKLLAVDKARQSKAKQDTATKPKLSPSTALLRNKAKPLQPAPMRPTAR